MKKPITVSVFRSLAAPMVLTAFLYGCATGASSWTEQATYHALVVASQYQEQLRVIVARMAIPGLTPEEIEEGVAKPLERSVDRVACVSKVTTQPADGSFVMEVHFKKGAGEGEQIWLQLFDVRPTVCEAKGGYLGSNTARRRSQRGRQVNSTVPCAFDG
jgi:hypothetical protein